MSQLIDRGAHVGLHATADDGCIVEVTYELTSVSARGEASLTATDADPSADIAAWRTPVTAYLHAQRDRWRSRP